MDNSYVTNSLQLHLFFGRIMKEHSLFLEAGFTPANSSFSKMAEFYKDAFEELLSRAVNFSNGNISREVKESGEIVTEFTLIAEAQTQHFTGIEIDSTITEEEICLVSEGCRNRRESSSVEVSQIQELNQMAMELLDGLINFKEIILENVLDCRMFTVNYPLLIEHIRREAIEYRKNLQILEKTGDQSLPTSREQECFWNQIMMEHAQFIRGLLDPSESRLMNTADEFAKGYGVLLAACDRVQPRNRTPVGTEESLEMTMAFREYKKAGTQGIENCEIRSMILPLLADHVLREANHYIRLLRSIE